MVVQEKNSVEVMTSNSFKISDFHDVEKVKDFYQEIKKQNFRNLVFDLENHLAYATDEEIDNDFTLQLAEVLDEYDYHKELNKEVILSAQADNFIFIVENFLGEFHEEYFDEHFLEDCLL